MDKISKLSQAIRLGATFRPQCTDGHYFNEGKSCAFGAAHEALTGEYNEVLHMIVYHVSERFVIPDLIADQIIKRNDDGGETREQIADWLEAQGL